MLNELITDYISKGNLLITAPPGGGSTTLALYLANQILNISDSIILYYNPSADINLEFISSYKNLLCSDIFFYQGKLEYLIKFLDYVKYKLDYIIFDPADTLMVNKDILKLIFHLFKGRIIATSQIRENPNLGGQVYSTLETLNLFNYSVWIRNVTESEQIFKSKYIDVFNIKRSGNNYERRYVAKFNTKTGNIIE